MQEIDTLEFGTCLRLRSAVLFLNRRGVSTSVEGGVLSFQWPEQEQRHILPVFIQGQGWFYPQLELERDYVRPLPEVEYAEEG